MTYLLIAVLYVLGAVLEDELHEADDTPMERLLGAALWPVHALILAAQWFYVRSVGK